MAAVRVGKPRGPRLRGGTIATMATKAKRENGSADMHFASLSSRISRWVGGGKTDSAAASYYNAAFPVAYSEGVANLYDFDANPTGSLVLCRAENKLKPLV